MKKMKEKEEVVDVYQFKENNNNTVPANTNEIRTSNAYFDLENRPVRLNCQPNELRSFSTITNQLAGVNRMSYTNSPSRLKCPQKELRSFSTITNQLGGTNRMSYTISPPPAKRHRSEAPRLIERSIPPNEPQHLQQQSQERMPFETISAAESHSHDTTTVLIKKNKDLVQMFEMQNVDSLNQNLAQKQNILQIILTSNADSLKNVINTQLIEFQIKLLQLLRSDLIERDFKLLEQLLERYGDEKNVKEDDSDDADDKLKNKLIQTKKCFLSTSREIENLKDKLMNKINEMREEVTKIDDDDDHLVANGSDDNNNNEPNSQLSQMTAQENSDFLLLHQSSVSNSKSHANIKRIDDSQHQPSSSSLSNASLARKSLTKKISNNQEAAAATAAAATESGTKRTSYSLRPKKTIDYSESKKKKN